MVENVQIIYRSQHPKTLSREVQAALLVVLVQQYKQENPRMTDAFIARHFNIPTSTVKSILGKR
jgi:hypothetical protein